MPATAQVAQVEALARRALLARATYHPTVTERRRVHQLGHDAWLDEQLAPSTVDDAALEARLGAYPWLGRTAAELRSQYGGGGWALSEESKAVRLLRATYSKRQLLERVVDFWNDHFNVPFSAQDANYLRPPYEENVIRAHALGTFPALLRAVAKSPAMGAFLDQDSNVAGAPNENWARELLELHTLGHDSGYTEHDVREVARCFTGWGYVRHWQTGTFGTFRFDAAAHDTGAKTVLGLTIPAGGGVDDGEFVVEMLLRDPRTVHHVSTKLVRWFLGEDAVESTDAVARVEAVWRGTGGSIRAMVREMLRSTSLVAVQPWRRRKLKRPFHFAVSLLRAVGAEVTVPTTAVYALGGLGQVPFEWPDPDGFPDEADAWVATLTPRWRFASQLLSGWASWAQVSVSDLDALLHGATEAQWPRAVLAAYDVGTFSAVDEAAIDRFVRNAPGGRDARLIGAFELGASSPSFQQF